MDFVLFHQIIMYTLSSCGKIRGSVTIYTKKRNEKLKDKFHYIMFYNRKILYKNWEGEKRDNIEKYFRGL